MRDVVILLIVVASLPLALWRPWIGVVAWCWLSFMNPHRMSYGFAYNMPFSQMVGAATLAGLVFTRDRKNLVSHWIMGVWIAYIVWLSITTLCAIDWNLSVPQWSRVMKVQLFAVLTVMLIRDKKQVHYLLWVSALSIGFFGLKGGLFALRVGGESRVWGPPGTVIEDNNALAVALLMVLPIIRYLQTTVTKSWMRWGLGGALVLIGLSILSSHSRGALIASSVLLLMLIAKSRHRMKAFLAVLLVVPAFLAFMPASWYSRMETLETYQEDASAMGRLTAWEFATRMAIQRPIGGGFGAFVEENYRRYAPAIAEQVDQRDGRYQGAHSIYFSVFGEHGLLGLTFFVLLVFGTVKLAGQIRARSKNIPELAWMYDLSGMLQVSVIAYAIGGAFLNLAYFDLFYTIVAITLVLHRVLAEGVVTTAGPTVTAVDAPRFKNVFASPQISGPVSRGS